MKTLALIPARGGSKGIPRKNMRLLNGKPLIQYTLEAALDCPEIDRVLVSTDDDDLIAFCARFDSVILYKRPPHLAADDTPMIDVVIDAIEYLQREGEEEPEAIALLQPTSPLRSSRHISEAIKLFNESGASTLTSVHLMREHPYECAEITKNGWAYLAKQGAPLTRRQDYNGEFVFINGAAYIVKTDYFLAERKILKEGETVFYFMEPENGVDIDDFTALRYAEFLLKQRNKNIRNGDTYEN